VTPEAAILVPLSERDLDLLQWFGEWTPEIHRATKETYSYRRTWPPGWRQMYDTGVTDQRKWSEARRDKAMGPLRDDGGRPVNGPGTYMTLVAYRLLEGSQRQARLTPRGRAALLYHGRPCPDFFKSHCPEIFDDVDLRPRWTTNDMMERLYVSGRPEHLSRGDLLPDERETWRRMLIEYREGAYHGRHTLTRGTATLTRFSSTGTYLNGSLRKHSGGLTISVSSDDDRGILEMDLSLEQLADLLTNRGSVPVTLGHFWGPDGMARSEPAPPTISVMRRMKERIRQRDETMDEDIQRMTDEISSLVEKNRLSKKLGERLSRLLVGARSFDASWVVHQAVEEISQTVESLLTVASERDGADRLVLGGRVASMLPGDDVPRLLGGGGDETD
jgi:hypothetical protein